MPTRFQSFSIPELRMGSHPSRSKNTTRRSQLSTSAPSAVTAGAGRLRRSPKPQRKRPDAMATRVMHQTNGQHRNQGNVLNKACPSIKSRPADLSVQTDDQPELPRQTTTDKPAYRVPSMAEVAAIPWN